MARSTSISGRLGSLCLAGLAVAAGSLGPARAQRPDQEPVATYRDGAEQVVVTRGSLAMELATHYRLRKEGKDALKSLIDLELVRRASKAEGVEASRAELETRWQRVETEFRNFGRDLDTFLASRGITRDDYRDELALSIQHAKLAARAVGISDYRKVTREMQELWLQDARQRYPVVTDPEQLPDTVLATVGGVPVGLEVLGDILIRTTTAREHEAFVRQIALRQLLEAMAAKEKIEVTAADIAAELDQRKREIEANPTFKGVPFEELIKAQGLTISGLKSSATFRANVILRRIIDRDYPPDRLQRMLENDRDAVLARHGPKRNLSVILIRAADPPNELIQRSFEDAEVEIKKLWNGIRSGAPFERVARLHSEEPQSQAKNGDVGLHRRSSPALPPEVLAAAFELDHGGVSAPVRTDLGFWLVRTSGVEPMPSDAELLRELRKELISQRTQELLDRAQVSMTTR